MRTTSTVTVRRPLVRITCAIVAALIVTACSDSSDYVYVEPATVVALGDGRSQVELTREGAERTGVELTEVATHDLDGAVRMVVPYSSVMYHYDGSTWTYTNPEPLVYVRAPITIDYIADGLAVLQDGPAVGTMVVSVGAAELYGVEFGIGK
jgi:hypothetical protein